MVPDLADIFIPHKAPTFKKRQGFATMVRMAKKILLSGIQPSGRPHIGNYFGAMKQFVELQEDFESYIFIADYHALTTLQNREELKQNILNVAIDYLAIGLNPKHVTLYKQSDIPEHMELAWIFECLTTVPYLERAHAFKDAQAKRSEVNVGTFNYPLLMASDILLYDADVVPVGQDQKQHVEIARDTAEKFNRIYGDTFKLPQPLILSNVSVVPGIDGEKMSKSKGNTIPLFAEDAEIGKLVMSIVTDSSGGIPKNVHEIHKLFALDGARLDDFYTQNEGKYKALKEALIEDIKTFIRPLREKRKAIAEDKEAVLKMLKEGGLRARAKASAKMEEVREKVGVSFYPKADTRKDFDGWNTQKKNIHIDSERVFFRQGELWWVRFGCNIGFELDGKGDEFTRPVLILKKYNQYSFLAVPLSTSKKENEYRVPIGVVAGKKAVANLSQLKNIDSKRLSRKIGTMEHTLYEEIKKKASRVNFG